MTDLFNSGIRPAIDDYLQSEAEKRRDYGGFWPASSAGYCMRKVIFDRLQIPYTTDPTDLARKQRVFSSGHIFHKWIQEITKNSGLSIAQELEVIDEDLMIKGHIDDLVLVKGWFTQGHSDNMDIDGEEDKLILYDYKTRNSRSFNYAKQPMETHRMQVGTYMYEIRKGNYGLPGLLPYIRGLLDDLTEARTNNIEKDTLRQAEVQYLYDDELEKDVVDYWTKLNEYWNSQKLPPCTCESFMATERYNDYFYNGKPCSLEHAKKHPQLKENWKVNQKEKTSVRK